LSPCGPAFWRIRPNGEMIVQDHKVDSYPGTVLSLESERAAHGSVKEVGFWCYA
jgi:hypothetical protein